MSDARRYMPYGPIQVQGQGQGHVVLRFRNYSILKFYLLRHFQWELTKWLLILKPEDTI